MRLISRVFCLSLFTTAFAAAQGLSFTDSSMYESTSKKQLFSNINVQTLPQKVDLSMYLPDVIDQGKLSTCVGVSVGYYMRTMMEAIRRDETDRSRIEAFQFSPSYLYNAIKTTQTNECETGTEIVKAFDHLKKNGVVSYKEQGYPSCQANLAISPAEDSKILDYITLFSFARDAENKIELTKKALAEKSPVVVGIQTTPSLQELGFWKSIWLRILTFFNAADDEDKSFSVWKPEKSDKLGGGHAVCLTGYDDTKYGGAFRVVNSYGAKWGDKGFFWIRYEDYLKHAKYGFQAFLPIKNNPDIAELSGEVIIEFTSDTTKQIVPFVKNDTSIVSGVEEQNSLVSYFLRDSQPTGKKYRVWVNVTQQAYVYILAENSSELFTDRLFPEGIESPSPIGRNTFVRLPLQLVPPTGTEYFLVLFSVSPIDNIDEYAEEVMSRNGPFVERVHAAFGDKLVPSQQIDFQENKMGFELKVKHSGEVVPLVVAFEHIQNSFTL